MTAPLPEATVTLFVDQAEEIARILDLFTDWVDTCGDEVVEDLTTFYYASTDATCIGWTAESLTWAVSMARHLNRAAAAARIHANGALS